MLVAVPDQQLRIEALPVTRVAEVVGVLSRGMRDNPNNVAAFGRDPVRLLRWTGAWGARDPDKPHLHLGPLAVEPHLRGRGIGSQILDEHCRHLDERGLGGYLETDRRENVRLYERFGYRVVAETSVIGVPNWFMWRQKP